ncbi:MAG: MDR family MFS transporter [Candidatus Tectomicrobia bacterium]|nr:MDR family MFS transporter [Candidatus Tectomicrobia bacterium]
MDRLEAQSLPPMQLALAAAGVLLAMFLSIFSQTIVATAMPRIIADLGGFDRYTWPATAYLVATAVAVPIVGRLSDIYGRRRFLLLGLVIFTLCSIPAGLSQSMAQLAAFRLLQGVGGGLIAASSFAAAADLFPPQDRGRFEAYAGLTFGTAAVAGPLLGGFITDHFGWSWVFLLNVPVGLAVLAIVTAFPKIRSEAADRRLDYPGMTTLVLAVASIMVGLSWASDGAAPATGLVAFGLAMAVVFVFIESRSDHPVMPLENYRDPTVVVSLIVVFLSGFGLYGSLLFTPLFFQVTLGMSAADSGRVLAPIVVGLVIGSVLSGQLVARTGGYYRAQAIAGAGMLAAAMLLLSAMNASTSLKWGMGSVFLAGIGVGGILATFRLAIQNAVPFRLVGAATSALQFCRLLSGTVGLAVLGFVFTRRLSARLDETLPESVMAALPPGRLDAIRNDPRALVDPVAADALAAGFEDIGPQGNEMANSLFAALDDALAGAVGDVFIISAGLVALSIIAAMFLRAPCHTAVQAHGPDDEGHHAA